MQVKITFQGMRNTDNWNHFAWLVNINGVDFEYRTGLGHAVKRYTSGKYTANKKPLNSITTDDSYVSIPQLDDILQCLFSDASAGSESFNDFCDNFGYSNDSLKALDTYRACMESASKLRKALGADYSAQRTRVESLNQ